MTDALRPHERWWEDHADTGGTFRQWLDESDPWSRREVIRIAETLEAQSVLEVGPGLFHDFETCWRSHPWMHYTALEMTPKLVDHGRALGAKVAYGNITAIPYPHGAFDVAYCRHVLEHLDPDEIDHALTELVRVAYRAAVVVLFRTTDAADHEPIQDTTAAPGTWCNAISPDALSVWAVEHGLTPRWTTAGRDWVLTLTW